MKSLESYQTAHAGLFKTETCYIYHYTACNGLRFETIASSLDECRKARDRWLRSLSVSFTGHRHLSEHTDSLILKLKEEIIRTYQAGKRFFKTGGAVGFDTLAAEVVLQLKEHLPELALMVIVPFEGQDIYFSPASKVRYRRILDQADEVVVLSATYFQHCYLRRNAYLVNHASRLIAYYDGVGTGGTSFTVRLAESKQIPVSNLFQ